MRSILSRVIALLSIALCLLPACGANPDPSPDESVFDEDDEEDIDDELVSETAAAVVTTGSKRIGVIMFKPRNYGTEWISPSSVRNVTWTGTASARAWYKEVSYGKLHLTSALNPDGDVFGWYTVPYDDDGRCVQSSWVTDARAKAAADGFVAANYDFIIYVSTATGCSARAWAGGNTSYVVKGYGMTTVVHELGHNFGLAHANTWRCKNAQGVYVPISDTCSSKEYGDFAAMGATSKYHMNSFHKASLGFFNASNVRDVTADGTFTIAPLERPTAAVQTVRIPRTYSTTGSVLDYYYLEFRQPYGFDSFAATDPRVNGVLIRVAPNYPAYARPNLLDATTPDLTNFSDAALAVGKTFNDPKRKLSITTVSVSSESATVKIDFQ